MKASNILILILGFICHRLEAVDLFIEGATEKVKSTDIKVTPKLATEASLPSYLPKVDVVIGEYVESEEDLIVEGCEPLSFKRFYHHLSPPDYRYGSWMANPETMLIANFDWSESELFASIGEKNGSLVRLNACKTFRLPKLFQSLYGQAEALCFTFGESLAARCTNTGFDPRNYQVAVWKTNQQADKFAWEGFIQDGSGRIREFSSCQHEWNKHKTVKLDPPDWKGDFSPEVWTPYCVPVKKEILPNGNVLVYEYGKWRDDTYFPNPALLTCIKAFNRDETILLGRMDIRYEKYRWKYEEELGRSKKGVPIKYREMIEDVSSCSVEGSDKRTALLINAQRHQAASPVLLQEARSAQSETIYKYENGLLTEVNKGNGRLFRTKYDPATRKVAAQYAPVGAGGEMAAVARFLYEEGATLVYDAENNKTVFRYDEKKRVTAIEKYLNNSLYLVERNIWGKDDRLEAQTIEDARAQIFKSVSFKYDAKGNLIEKTESGFGSDKHTVSYTYAGENELLNLKLSEKEGKKETRFTYKPNTNLVASEIVYEGKTIRKRTFYAYDDCAVCIRKVVDDGKSLDEHDLKGVTYRKITEITPRRELPCFGLPEIVEEKTINSKGKEILLSKVVYAYHPSGKIAREDHYDAQGIYRYSILNEYDDKERLKKTIDALGYQTFFLYDPNGNLIAYKAADIEKQWVYDQANRQVAEKICGIETRKVYDKLGRVIEEIDACQNKTKYVYDGLGRPIATIYADGGVEKKEYDVLGNVTKVIDPNGYSTLYSHNFRGKPTHIIHPDGSSEHFIYTANGLLKEYIDRNCVKTVYTFDAFDHPIKIETFANGKLIAAQTATYSPFNKLSETDIEGNTTVFAYDFAGRKISEKKGNKETKYTYDALGRLAKTQIEDVFHIQEYDLCGRVIEKRVEDMTGNIHSLERYSYDHAGRQIAVETCEGKREIEYNGLGLPVRMISADGNATSISYLYKEGAFSKQTFDPAGNTTTETFGPCNRLKSFLVKNNQGEVIQHREFLYDPAGYRTHAFEHVYENARPARTLSKQWVYGPMGRLEKELESGTKEISYAYDLKGRLKTILKADGTEISYAYDDLGRLSNVSSSKRDINYTYAYDIAGRITSVNGVYRQYDSSGNLIKEKQESGYVVKNAYDDFGRRTKLTLPDGSKVHYTYKNGKLYEVSYKEQKLAYVERNLADKPTAIVLPGDLGPIQIAYDACLRVKNIAAPHYAAATLYDSLGRLVQASITDSQGTVERKYGYDDLSQLISENEESFGYDSLYNRICVSQGLCLINDLCQLIKSGEQEFLYDANGNLIQAGDIHYSYDSLDRLVKMEKDGMTYEYFYDGLNRRYMKKTPSKYIHFIWDDKKEIGSSVGELRIPGEETGCLMILDGKTYIPLYDHLGSLATLLNTKGEAVETTRYSAFGIPMTQNSLSPWRYLSRRYDPETEFVYFDKGYYMPKLGRWLTPLSKEEPNPYAYKKNNPLTVEGLY